MFRLVRRRPLTAAFVTVLIAAGGFAVAAPAGAACVVMGLAPLSLLPDGSLADAGLSSVEREAALSDRQQAITRIAATFGAPRARPVIVHVSRPDALWPFTFNSFGSTSFVPGRACIVIGPDGRGVDVLAHELVHAEVFDRVGWWRRLTAVPTWFDEGSGMQVDYRAAFDLPKAQSAATTAAIQSSDTTKKFFGVPPQQLMQHYSHSKVQVAAWLNRVGQKTFYDRLAALHYGKPFEQVWNE